MEAGLALPPRCSVALTPLGFHHLALQARDVERVAAFYREVLHLPELTRYHRDDGALRSVWLAVSPRAEPGDGFLAVEAAPDDVPAGTLGFSMLALRIAPGAREGLVRELAAAGIVPVRETGWTVYIRDPEGNLVGLSHHPHPRP